MPHVGKCVAYPGSSLKGVYKTTVFPPCSPATSLQSGFLCEPGKYSLCSFMLAGMLLSVFNLGMNSMSALCNDQQYQFSFISLVGKTFVAMRH